jgi:hypothetical protein
VWSQTHHEHSILVETEKIGGEEVEEAPVFVKCIVIFVLSNAQWLNSWNFWRNNKGESGKILH